jgi:hypothetical protein
MRAVVIPGAWDVEGSCGMSACRTPAELLLNAWSVRPASPASDWPRVPAPFPRPASRVPRVLADLWHDLVGEELE